MNHIYEKDQAIYRKLYDRYGSVLRPYGISNGQPLKEDYRVSSMVIDNCQFVIVGGTFIKGTRKIVIAPDILYDSANDCYIVVLDKTTDKKIFSLEDYKPYNLDEYDNMCKQIDYILYRKKQLDIVQKISRIDKIFKQENLNKK